MLPTTVLLETEWVLRAGHGFAAEQIMGFLRALLGLPGVRAAEPEAVFRVLAACESGLDFADALHLPLADGAERFYTFDADLRREAGRAMPQVQMGAPA